MLRRNIKVTFRLDEKEFEELKRNVKRSGYAQEHYIRTVLSGFIPREHPTHIFHEFMKQLRSIGNSMDQIAEQAHMTGDIDAEKYVENTDAFWKMYLEILESTIVPDKIKKSEMLKFVRNFSAKR